MSDEQVQLTPAEAEGLLPDGDWTHSMVFGGMMILGCDLSRADAVKMFADAKSIQLGGPVSYSLRHPILVFSQDDRMNGVQADMDKVAAFEAAQAEQVTA